MKYLVICLLSVSQLCHGFQIGVSQALLPPVANIYLSKGGATLREEGILFELSQHIAKQLNEPVSVKILARENMDKALLAHQVDSLCYFNPNWINLPSEYLWSDTFISNTEYFVSRPDLSTITHFNELKGLRIGLINGHVYENLKSLLADNLISPIYSDNESNNFFSLYRNSEIDGVILKEINLKYFLKTQPKITNSQSIKVHPLLISKNDVACVLHPSQAHLLESINQAIAAFKSQSQYAQ